jgi:hypothetical protein
MIKQTPWRIYWEDGRRYRIQVNYGIDYAFAARHNQAPYFSMTGETQIQARGNNRWMHERSGSIHEAIQAHYPRLAPYVKWHLVGSDGPSHYLANGLYWFSIAQGKSDNFEARPADPLEAFKSTIVFPGFPGDEPPPELREDLEHGRWHAPWKPRHKGPKEWSPRASALVFFRGVPIDLVEGWLQARLPALMAAWVVDMGELGVLE